MTFCGLYWLIDSQISQYACADDAGQAELLREFAAKLMLLYEGDTIGMPIINSVDGVGTAKARIKRSADEDESPDASGNVTLPTEDRVKEMTAPCVVNMTKNADGTYTADMTFTELKAAHDAGRTVICSFRDLTQQWQLPGRLPLVWVSDTGMGFAAVIQPETDLMLYAWAYINSVGIGYAGTELRNLPESTTDDNGKVLTVAGGLPVWTDKSPCIVNMVKNADGTYAADMTFAALKAAHDTGRTVICSYKDLAQEWENPFMLPLVLASSDVMGFAAIIGPDHRTVAYAYIGNNRGAIGYVATELIAENSGQANVLRSMAEIAIIRNMSIFLAEPTSMRSREMQRSSRIWTRRKKKSSRFVRKAA